MLIVARHDNGDSSVSCEGANAVPNAVLDEWLKQQGREQQIVGTGIDVDRNAKTRPKSALLYRDVRPQKLDLVGDRHETMLLELEGTAEERLQFADNRPSLRDIVVRCLGSKLQRVEEKVRLQLQGERSKLGLGEHRFELATLSLPLQCAV